MRPVRLAVALAGSLWLAGCTVPRPPPTIAASLPAQWHAPLPHGGSLADLRRWWLQFRDPLLVDLVAAAQAISPDIASAAARLSQARAARAAANGSLLPSVDAALSASRGNAQAGLPAPATLLQGSTQAAWEIDLFGGRLAGLDAATARLRASEAGWHEARVAVAAETALAYVDLRTCEHQLEVTRDDARSRAETARLTQLSAGAGFTAPAVAALAGASAAEAAARVTQQQAQCHSLVKALVALSGFAEPHLRERLRAPRPQPAPAGLLQVASVPAELLAQRPDVYQAQLEVAAASAEVGAARADRYPRLSLSGQINAGWIRVGGQTSEARTWAIGPLALSLPLLDGGQRAANLEAAVARYEEAAARYHARVRQGVREVEQALVALASARERTEDLQFAVQGYRRSFVATEARYRGGLASLIELEDQRRAALAAETALVALQRERLAAWIALYRAVGGGWERPQDAPRLTTP